MQTIHQCRQSPALRQQPLPPTARPAGTRSGKVLVLIALCLPMLMGILGLVIDGSLLMSEHRELQHVADMAATAAARELALGSSATAAEALAVEFVTQHNQMPDADVDVNIPPVNGAYAGQAGYVEVIVTRNLTTYFIQVLNSDASQPIKASAVAGLEDATASAALVILDPDPSRITISGLPISLPTLPTLQIGGMEVLGLGQLNVEGAVLVNCEWGGVDENGDPAGVAAGLPYALSCTPLLALTKLRASDIRVTGGVDVPTNYGNIALGESSPLRANRLPVPDPLRLLPPPTLAADPANVSADEHGTVNVISLPLILPPVTLEPGVYESIQVLAGRVVFEPGVYIIRNVDPLTGLALSIVAGQVTAEGVMFYITDSTAYSPSSGFPDASDGETEPAGAEIISLVPRVVINVGILGSRLTGLSDPGSPFDGMLIYQRRTMRHPIVLVAEQLLGSTELSGRIYAKWGQLVLVGNGTFDLSAAVGTARCLSVLDCTLEPTHPFPPAQDVFLVE